MKHLLFLLILTIPALITRAATPSYVDLVGDADKAIAEGRWNDAEQLLVDAMRLDPANPFNVLLMSNVGMMQFNQGRDSVALATLNDAHAIAPASATIRSNRAKILTALGRLDEAYADYSAIIEIDSIAATPRFNRGMIALKRHDIPAATADFEFLERHSPDGIETAIGLASLYSAVGKWSEAIPYFNRVIDAEPLPHFYSGRALCRLMMDQLSEAADDISRGLELDPHDGELYLYRAALNKMRYRTDDARRDAERARSLGIPEARLRDFL